MFGRIKLYLGRCLYKLIRPVIPGLAILDNRQMQFQSIENYIADSVVSEKAKLYPVYRCSKSSIGDYTYIAQNSNISLVEIGKFCSIGPNFIAGWGIHPTNGVSTHPMFFSTLKQNGTTLASFDKITERKKINIGNDVFIGMNVTVLDGVTIGDGAIIGAGAVVSKDIPPYAIAVGSPIRVIKYRHTPEVIRKMLLIKWWNWKLDKLTDVEMYFNDIDSFIQKWGADF